MLVEGAWLMGIGMTTVFVFLVLLVGLMHLSTRLLAQVSTGDEARRLAVAVAAARRAREMA